MTVFYDIARVVIALWFVQMLFAVHSLAPLVSVSIGRRWRSKPYYD